MVGGEECDHEISVLKGLKPIQLDHPLHADSVEQPFVAQWCDNIGINRDSYQGSSVQVIVMPVGDKDVIGPWHFTETECQRAKILDEPGKLKEYGVYEYVFPLVFDKQGGMFEERDGQSLVAFNRIPVHRYRNHPFLVVVLSKMVL